MKKAIACALFGAALAVLGVASFPSSARAVDSVAPTCVTHDRTDGLQLTYTVGQGITVSTFRASGVVPAFVGDRPNPDFDRVFAMMMRGLDDATLEELCFAGSPEAGDARVVSVRLRGRETPGLNDVVRTELCGPGGCVNFSAGALVVTDR